MSDPTAQALETAKTLIAHAEASRYVTMAGFTILVFDHLSTFDDEVRFMWPAPRSFVKFLYFTNRYLTLSFQAVVVYQASRLAVFSDIFCKWWINAGGFVEVGCLAMSDLLLLYRLHALWGGRRSVVIATYILYFVVYACITGVGLVSAVQLYPHLHYGTYQRTCATDFKPLGMSIIFTFGLSCEVIIFALTAAKAFRLRQGAQMRSPVVTSLYGGQFSYYLIIIIVRIFNLIIWGILPPSLMWLGVFFLWAMVTTLVSRIMLHLRRAACERSQPDETVFGATVVQPSTRIVRARRANPNATTMDPPVHRISQGEVRVAESESGLEGNVQSWDRPIELKSFRSRSRFWP